MIAFKVFFCLSVFLKLDTITLRLFSFKKEDSWFLLALNCFCFEMHDLSLWYPNYLVKRSQYNRTWVYFSLFSIISFFIKYTIRWNPLFLLLSSYFLDISKMKDFLFSINFLRAWKYFNWWDRTQCPYALITNYFLSSKSDFHVEKCFLWLFSEKNLWAQISFSFYIVDSILCDLSKAITYKDHFWSIIFFNALYFFSA